MGCTGQAPLLFFFQTMALVAVALDPVVDWERVPAKGMVFLDKLPGAAQPGGSHLLVNVISGQRHMWGDGSLWLIGFHLDEPLSAFIYDADDPAQDPVDVFSMLDQIVLRRRTEAGGPFEYGMKAPHAGAVIELLSSMKQVRSSLEVALPMGPNLESP